MKVTIDDGCIYLDEVGLVGYINIGSGCSYFSLLSSTMRLTAEQRAAICNHVTPIVDAHNTIAIVTTRLTSEDDERRHEKHLKMLLKPLTSKKP